MYNLLNAQSSCLRFVKRILSYILLCIPLFAMAQQEDSISLRKVVSPERQLLLKNFRAGRLDSVVLLVDSIDRHRDTPFLWSAERLLLYYWIERHQAIDSLALHFSEVNMEAVSNHPAEQIVWNVLSFHSIENIDTLVSWIDQSGCDDREFRFRVQLLETMLFGDGDDQESVNREIATFVSRYVRDEEKSAREIIQNEPQQFESETSDTPWGFELGFGLGPTYTSGRITDYFSTHWGLSINLNVYCNRWNFSLLMQPIFAKLKRDIPVGNDDGDIWEAGEKAIIGNFGLTLGYSIVNNRFMRINPFIGLSFSDCSPDQQQIEKNEALNDVAINWGFTSMYGIDTGFRLNSIFGFLKRNNIPLLFNVRLNYIPAMFNNVNPRYSGNMFLITCGFSIDLSNW